MCMPAVPKMHATTLKFLWLIMCTSKNTLKTISVQNPASRIQCPALSTTCSHDQHYTNWHEQHYTSSHDQHYTNSHDQHYCGSNSSRASTNLKRESHVTFKPIKSLQVLNLHMHVTSALTCYCTRIIRTAVHWLTWSHYTSSHDHIVEYFN